MTTQSGCREKKLAWLRFMDNLGFLLRPHLLQLCWNMNTFGFFHFPPDTCLAYCCDCLFGEYWFRLSRYVYDCNRSFAPILRQSRWSLLCDVYWLEMMMLNTWTGTSGTWTGSRIEIPEHSSGSELFFSLLNNKQAKNRWKWKQWSNNEQNKSTINNDKSTSN